MTAREPQTRQPKHGERFEVDPKRSPNPNFHDDGTRMRRVTTRAEQERRRRKEQEDRR
jgi:hypothetical protein